MNPCGLLSGLVLDSFNIMYRHPYMTKSQFHEMHVMSCWRDNTRVVMSCVVAGLCLQEHIGALFPRTQRKKKSIVVGNF